MKWEKIVKKDDNSVSIPWNWLLPQYYEALNVLFRIENALRVFVYIVLKNEFKDKWLDINIESDDKVQNTVIGIAKQRLYQTRRFAYLGYLIHCPLMYLTSGELIHLIVSDTYWKYFRPYFPGSKEIISNKLDEIGAVRNALAHFRPIRQEDIEVIKQNAVQVLPKVELCLMNLILCENIIPTNTKDDWFNDLKLLITENNRLTITQSEDEKWVKLSFKYFYSTVNRDSKHLEEYRILSLNTPKILTRFPELKALLIYLAEGSTDVVLDGNFMTYSKPIHMVFSHSIIEKEYGNIKLQLDNLLTMIAEETNLLYVDNLARGEIVQVVNASVKYVKSKYKIDFFEYNTEQFNNSPQEDDPPEYWGLMSFEADDYITSTYEYPWMPDLISHIPI